MTSRYERIPVCAVPFVERDRELRAHPALVAPLQATFGELIERDPRLADIVSQIAARGGCGAVFGGWVRDHVIGLLAGEWRPPRDIDLVVHNVSSEELRAIVGPTARENIFGGYTAPTTTTSLDVWRLETTFVIARDSLPVEFATLPATTVFRINSLVFLPRELASTPQLLDAGAISAIKGASIDFQTAQVPFPHVQVGRAAMYAAKLAYVLTPEVREFMRRVCSDEADVALVEFGLGQFCPATYLAGARRALRDSLDVD